MVDHDDIYDDDDDDDDADGGGCGFTDKSCGDGDRYICLSILIIYLSIHQSIHLSSSLCNISSIFTDYINMSIASISRERTL